MYATLARVIANRFPLLMRKELEVAIFVDALCEFAPRRHQRARLAMREVGGPSVPAAKIEMILERAEQRVVVNPVGIFLDEVVERAPLTHASARCERLERPLQQFSLEGDVFLARD